MKEPSLSDIMGKLYQMDEKIDSLQNDVGSLQNDVGSLQNNMSSMQNNMSSMQNNMSSMQNNISSLQNDVASLQNDVASLKGRAVCDAARMDARTIARALGTEYVRILDRSEVTSMSDKAKNEGRASNITKSSIMSFRKADMVIEAQKDGCQHYITVESSYTADAHDAARADRNAEYIKRFTGRDSDSVVACVSANYDTAKYTAYLHTVQDRALAPE